MIDQTARDYRDIGKRDYEPVVRLDPSVKVDDAVALVQCANTGTGFLIPGNRLMTNHHVLPDPESVAHSSARFGYRKARDGTVEEGESFVLSADVYFRTNADLDYTVVGLETSPPCRPIPISSDIQIAEGDSVVIIGHPARRDAQVSRRDAAVVRIDPPFIGYRADTEHGSSGSPVFDTSWQLVALHHKSAPLDSDDAGNEGVLIGAIAADFGRD